MFLLDLNDADVRLCQDRDELYRGPAVAVFHSGVWHFGQAAQRVARMHPQQTNRRYLGRMDADPLPHPAPGAANHADLVYLHLKELAPLVSDPLVLAVPSTFNADQLGVLLGICQEVGLEIAGFVDGAVAAASTLDGVGDCCCVEVYQHRFGLTRLALDEGELVRREALEINDCGLEALYDSWANVLADRFVQDTRFDPLHTAATEQQLYNQLDDWLHQGAPAGARDLRVVIDQNDQQRQAEASRASLAERTRQRLRPVGDRLEELQAAGEMLVLSERCAALPGMAELLDGLELPWRRLPADAVARGALRHLDRIASRDGQLRLTLRLPVNGEAAPSPAAGAPAGESPTAEPDADPTHLLCGDLAWPLADAAHGLTLTAHAGGYRLQPDEAVRLNGAPVREPTDLALGDRVRQGERELRLIRVEG